MYQFDKRLPNFFRKDPHRKLRKLAIPVVSGRSLGKLPPSSITFLFLWAKVFSTSLNVRQTELPSEQAKK